VIGIKENKATTRTPLERPRLEQATVEGLPIVRATLKEVVSELGRWLLQDQPRRVATANLDFLRLAHKDSSFRECLRTADMVTADGMPVLWLAKLRGQPLPERVAGSDLVLPLLKEAADRGARVYLLGGNPTEAEHMAKRVYQQIPHLLPMTIAAPVVDLADVSGCVSIAEQIRESRSELLLVGLGCPKQERFLERYLDATGARVGIGVGRAFAFLGGTEKRAPKRIRAVGLEWCIRLWHEPRRLAKRYCLDLVYLVPRLLQGLMRRRP
jgi:exopolysaccharide biosynthesis WecB/TagA/CpsF family protein